MEKLVNKLINAYKELALIECDSKYEEEVIEYKQRLREMIFTLTA